MRAAYLLILLLTIAACSDLLGARTPARVEITAPASELYTRRTVQLTAKVMDSRGRSLSGYEVAWYTGDPYVAAVTLSGKVEGVAPGTVEISAFAGGAMGSIDLTVLPIPINEVLVDLGPGYVNVGGTRAMAAYVSDIDGARVTDRLVVWALSDSTKVSLQRTGNTTAHAIGMATGPVTVTASVGGVSGSAVLQVTCPTSRGC